MTEGGNSCEKGEYPDFGHILGRAILLGVIATILGVFMLALVLILATYASGGPPGDAWVSWEGGMLLVGLGVFAAGLPMATIAATIVAFVMSKLSTQQGFSQRKGMLIGAAVGLLAGSAIWLATVMLTGSRIGLNELSVMLLVGGITIVAGMWHGWQLARWIQKKRGRCFE